jgi:Uma2 family endonuclease
MSTTLKPNEALPSRSNHPLVSIGDCLPLENGDHLTRAEFERRYKAMPHLKKAELINGRVFMQAAVRHYGHSEEHLNLAGIFMVYAANTLGTEAGDNGSIRVDDENMPQPDLFVRLDSRIGGQSTIDPDGYVQGIPELAAEISASSASYDLHEKRRIYEQGGIKEYIVWKTLEPGFVFFRNENGVLHENELGTDGVFRSQTFPGLWIDALNLTNRKPAKALKTLQQGLDSSEHAEFIKTASSVISSDKDE